MATVGDVCNELAELAPLSLAEDWDNVGLLLGDRTHRAERVLTCLTLTPDVADEAVASKSDLIVTHHPILFKPVKKISGDTADGSMLLKLIQHRIAVYSPHTAWDNSRYGINQQLADRLKLQNVASLRPRPAVEQFKVVTFVPQSHLDAVQTALWNSGAGVIGEYQKCSFRTSGVGTFFGSDAANPAVGQAGQLEAVEELRLEVVCAGSRISQVMDALRTSHPYEEPAIDVYPLKTLPSDIGSGRYGDLSTPMTLADLTRMVSLQLRQPMVQFVGDPQQQVHRVAIACGSAAEFLRDAQRSGCQAFLTGEARFHSCLEARDSKMGMILPGHYASERFAMETLAEVLVQRFKGLSFTASQSERDPVQSI